jgi:hypothetical protein
MAREKISALRSPFYSNLVGGAKFTVNAKVSTTITVNVQLTKSNLDNLAARGNVQYYLASTPDGGTYAPTGANGGVAGGANGSLIQDIAGRNGNFTSNATGQADVAITDSGNPLFYLVIVLPDGSIAVSPAIQF